MEDLIDRQAAIDTLDAVCDRVCQYTKKERSIMCGACLLGCAFDAIEELPSVQPEQKFGKWIRHENEDGEPYGHNCSVCGEWYVMPYGKTKFCPNCGAKMEE